MEILAYIGIAVLIATFAFLWDAFRESGRELDDHDSADCGASEGRWPE